MNIPKHIAIIMDGNGRWAKQRNQVRAMGHRAGLKAIRKAVRFASNKGIQALTLYAFSSENWNRPESEVRALMALFVYALNREVQLLHKNNIRLNIIGDFSRFDKKIQLLIEKAELKTKNNNGLILNIAANYGGRWDIVNGARRIAEDIKNNKIQIDDINESLLKSHLSLFDIPEVDLMIRTGGEYRISNFLLWQLAYAELYFLDVLWPDFDEIVFQDALNDFSSRERRFGALK